MKMEVITPLSSAESKVKKYPYACVCVRAQGGVQTRSVDGYIYLQLCVVVYFVHKDMQMRYIGRRVPQMPQVLKQITET